MGYFAEIYSEDLLQAGLLEKEQRWRENGGKSSLLYTIKQVQL